MMKNKTICQRTGRKGKYKNNDEPWEKIGFAFFVFFFLLTLLIDRKDVIFQRKLVFNFF